MKKYGYHEVRILTGDDLRGICIRNNWCTHCSCKEYSELLDKAQYTTNITTDDIVELGALICEYSNLGNDDFESVCFELIRGCMSWIAEDEDN